jgi:hypothetical protein
MQVRGSIFADANRPCPSAVAGGIGGHAAPRPREMAGIGTSGGNSLRALMAYAAVSEPTLSPLK